mgnify:CR=1 FL=1
MDICIKIIAQSKYDKALKLVLSVFRRYVAPDYQDEGVRTFIRSVIENDEYMVGLTVYGAYKDGELAGVLATKNNGAHIALFFVDGMQQRQGIGRALFLRALKDNQTGVVTVNSSPYAVEVYRCLGFKDTDTEQVTDGIRYTPMKYTCPCRRDVCRRRGDCAACRKYHKGRGTPPVCER